MPEQEQSPKPPEFPAAKDDIRTLLKEAISEAISPLQQQLEAQRKEIERLEFEAANAQAPVYTGVYQGRPDSAVHVTLATRPALEAPEQYAHVVGALKPTKED